MVALCEESSDRFPSLDPSFPSHLTLHVTLESRSSSGESSPEPSRPRQFGSTKVPPKWYFSFADHQPLSAVEVCGVEPGGGQTAGAPGRAALNTVRPLGTRCERGFSRSLLAHRRHRKPPFQLPNYHCGEMRPSRDLEWFRREETVVWGGAMTSPNRSGADLLAVVYVQ